MKYRGSDRKKYRHMFFLSKYSETDHSVYVQKRFIHWPLYRKINVFFHPTVTYNAFQNNFMWAKRTLKNFRYHSRIKSIKRAIVKSKIRSEIPFKKSMFFRKKRILSFLKTYLLFFASSSIDVLHFLKKNKIKKNKLFFYLIFSFNNGRLFVNIQNHKKRNFFFLSQGFFIKFFEKKKSLKKTKTFKMLTAKYLRKLYLLNRIKYNIFIIKKNPVFFLEILNFLHSPIIHKFNAPYIDGLVEEKKSNNTLIKVLYFVFIKNKDFSKNKYKKKGRIKRKITRKLVLENSVTD